MIPKRYLLKLENREMQLGDRPLLVGVLNVTPDSFSDGGKYQDPDHAFAHAFELEEAGADIIDIGAESTRPGAPRISEAEELRRLVPVLKRLRNKLSVPVMVDTYKAGVAEKAIEHGAEFINDPSGLTLDPDLARVVAQRDVALIINHMRGTPDSWAKLPPMQDPMGGVLFDLSASVSRAMKAGVDRKRIFVDPGLGFGKRKEQNFTLIADLERMVELDVPIMVGPSRKSFLGIFDPKVPDFATAAAVAGCVLNGAHMIRVHDVAAMRTVVEISNAILHSATEIVRPEVVMPRNRDRRPDR